MKINENNWIVRFFFTWGGLPWKKPLIMVSCVHFLVMETVSLCTGHDVPALMGEIYKAYMVAIIIAGFGSSGFSDWMKNNEQKK
jgi:hypothetical protein